MTPPNLCSCGCGQPAPKGGLAYIPGHNPRNRNLAPPKHLKPLVRRQEPPPEGEEEDEDDWMDRLEERDQKWSERLC